VIDDQFAPLSAKIRTAIGRLSDQPVRFVLNTHWHPDHTGGNAVFAEAGALIVAHSNTRKRLETGQFIKAFNHQAAPAPPMALPVMTFSDAITLHWNNQTIEVIHPMAAHTDGDAVVFFREANVIHTGDLYTNGAYPFIDADSGGSLKGLIRGVNNIIARCDSNTSIIPGHGALSYLSELKAYRDMLTEVYGRLTSLSARGKTAEAIMAENPLEDLDEAWGQDKLSTDQWLKIVLEAL
jgi:glyoxylase-like metal-dependent hydrolase (beta-lactamase superfamily II)